MHTPRLRILSPSILIALALLATDGGREAGIGSTARGLDRVKPRIGQTGAIALGDRAGTVTSAARTARPIWRADELMVRARDGEDVAAIAAGHGLSLRRAPGPSGLGAVRVAGGQDLDGLLEALRADPRVASADRVGMIFGADKGGGGHHDESEGDDSEGEDASDGDYSDYQWHLDAIGARDLACGDCDPGAFTVAVLDTGVAYEDYTEDEASGGRSFVVASSLSDTSFVAPLDLVEGDGHPNDDNQHGTHIASLIASSSGLVQGVAPGVAIMPIKVLDADNVGSEVDLVDAIVHAVDNGADIINMSLCFAEGYAPSSALREALEYAAASGVLMVGAAGNDGVQAALYPAASPLVISVGASQLAEGGSLELTSYSNTSPTLDVLAPGGNLEEDMDGDGYVDGILAETIDPEDPTELGLWFYAGTSQATALVSGSLVWLLAAGETDPERITRALQAGADGHEGWPYLAGTGAGDLAVDGALDAAAEGGDALDAEMAYHVAILPYLERVSSKKVRPVVRLSAVDGDGEPAAKVHLVGSWWGEDGASAFRCKTDANGVCTVKGASRKASTSDELAWGVSVDAAYPQKAVSKGWQSAARPGAAMFMSDGLVILAEALDAKGMLYDTPLGISWSESSDGTLGKLAAAYSVVNAPVGAALRPEALLFTPGALEPIATFEDLELDLADLGYDEDLIGEDGDGAVVLVTVDGTGIVSDPLGLVPIKIVFLSGTGIVSDPLGIRTGTLYNYTFATGIVSDPLGFTSKPLLLSTGTLVGSSLDGYALGELMDAGGWLDDDDYPAASLLMSTGVVGTSLDDTSVRTGALGGTRLE